MLDRLEYDERDPERPRRELDSSLEVASWGSVQGVKPRVVRADTGTPRWWHGDEDASQSFLRAMGVLT